MFHECEDCGAPWAKIHCLDCDTYVCKACWSENHEDCTSYEIEK